MEKGAAAPPFPCLSCSRTDRISVLTGQGRSHEPQDVGSVYTKSRKRDFSIHFHLAPERLSEP